MNNDIYESGEDYLETILQLTKQQGQVRSIDIAHALDYSKPSVSRAMKVLSEKGLIYMDGKKLIYLTELGQKTAEGVARRHRILKAVLVEKLGIDEAVAEEEACRIEHIISDETIEKINARLDNPIPE